MELALINAAAGEGTEDWNVQLEGFPMKGSPGAYYAKVFLSSFDLGRIRSGSGEGMDGELRNKIQILARNGRVRGRGNRLITCISFNWKMLGADRSTGSRRYAEGGRSWKTLSTVYR